MALVDTFAVLSYLTVERRVDVRVADVCEIGRQLWMTFVEAGISQDSATTLALRDMRGWFEGQAASTPRSPVTMSPAGELVWQPRMRNPLQPANGNLPRSDAEALRLQENRASVERVVRDGRRLVVQRI
ncbi:hypothetical protein [Gemmatimonas sp.]|uniref:hypothetical protein n=1 Tax=Gemmatimonas sp. TaxID=1962908 RepID=UPI00356AC111